MFVRAIARPLLASWFVYASVDALLDPTRHARKAAPIVEPVLEDAGVNLTLPQLVRAHSAATLVAAGTLALSRTPRTAAMVLAGLATVTAATSEPFWLEEDEDARAASRESFVKNISLLGGALLAATAGGSRRRKKKSARKKTRR